jgi:uncharacterized protein with PIN domain
MKFLCDGMLGKLCKYLRLCGIDTRYSNEGLKALIQARKEERIILTRNTQLGGRAGVYFIAADDPIAQVKSVLVHYGINDDVRFFSRCLMCNEPLSPVPKERIKGKVPYYTFRKFSEFAECPACQRVYWKGSHYANMQKKINAMLRNAG